MEKVKLYFKIKKAQKWKFNQKIMKNKIIFNYYSGHIMKKFIISDGYITYLKKTRKNYYFLWLAE